MSYTKNLYDETTAALQQHGYDWNDIVAVQGFEVRISVEKFIALAKQTEYSLDSYTEYGIFKDLILIMKDGSWFEREIEYGEGSEHSYEYAKTDEYWQYRRKPKMLRTIEDDKVTTLIPRHDYYLGNEQ